MSNRVIGAFAALAAFLFVGAGAASADVTATTSFIASGASEFTVPEFTVPAGVSSISVTLTGAAGGSDEYGCNGVGGKGATISATLAVTPGEQLQVGVGAVGGAGVCGQPNGGGGGTGGGGAGGDVNPGGEAAGAGAGGGGASWVGVPFPGSPQLVLAGGGGGAGGLYGGNGGDAGSAGDKGVGTSTGGDPGTSSAGGAGGAADTCGDASPGAPGSFMSGGAGGAGDYFSANGGTGGGGGGGYYGGGGGGGSCISNGSGAGGGGGSSYAGQSATNETGPAVTSDPAMVSITYDVPTADESSGSIGFGTQAQGTASAEQDVTLTNNGSAPLVVSGVLLSGANPGDYLIDNHQCQQPVAAGSSCTIGVRFDPQAAGASSATMTVLTNAPTAPGAVSLSGTGGSLPQGPAGAAGATGATGAQGPAGKVELVTCKTVIRHHHKVQKCKGRLVSGTVKFTTTGKVVHAAISRGRVFYATGESVPAAGGGSLLVLNAKRRLARGSYTLTLRGRHETHRTRITIG